MNLRLVIRLPEPTLILKQHESASCSEHEGDECGFVLAGPEAYEGDECGFMFTTPEADEGDECGFYSSSPAPVMCADFPSSNTPPGTIDL